ncbi:hypothetical protein [[Eubacterium] cellulosolvens]
MSRWGFDGGLADCEHAELVRVLSRDKEYSQRIRDKDLFPKHGECSPKVAGQCIRLNRVAFDEEVYLL